MSTEYTQEKDKIYLLQDTDGVLKPISFTHDQLHELEIPLQSAHVETYQSSGDQVDPQNAFENEVETNVRSNVSIENVQIISQSTQNVLVAQSITNLIPINQNVRFYAIDDSSTTKVCQPVIFKKRLISVPSQNVPIISQMPVTLVDASESTYQNGLIKIISTDSIREEKLTLEPSNSDASSAAVQLKKKTIIENKPDLILSTNDINQSKSSNFNVQLFTASQSGIVKSRCAEMHINNGKKNLLVQSSKKPSVPILKKEPHTTVHLLQNGKEYQSVEQLDEDKLRIVAGAINRVTSKRGPKNTVIYDPKSKTKIIYRVVYPEDLNLSTKTSSSSQPIKPAVKRGSSAPPKDITSPPVTPKVMSVTRSGRVVKLPRTYESLSPQPVSKSCPIQKKDGSTLLPKEYSDTSDSESHLGTRQIKKRKCGVLARRECSKCEKVFRGYKRINQHYLEFPDHKVTSPIINSDAPNSTTSCTTLPTITAQACTSKHFQTKSEVNAKVENPNATNGGSLFEHLMNILESMDADKRAALFVQELETLMQKLQGLVPCITKLKQDNSNTQCVVSESVARLLNITSGVHNFDMSAIKCATSQGCEHNNTVNSSAPGIWFLKSFETNTDTIKELRDCARTNSFDKWLLDVGKNRESISPQKLQNDQTKVCWSTLPDAINIPVTLSIPSPGLSASDAISEKVAGLGKNTFNETWLQDVASCSTDGKCAPLMNDSHHMDSIASQATSNISFLNNLNQQFVYATSNLNMPMDIDGKNQIDCGDIQHEQQNNVNGKFSFGNSAFKFENTRVNNEHESFDKIDLNRRSLPSFMKIERRNGLHLPGASLEDIVTSQINDITTAGSLIPNATSISAISNSNCRDMVPDEVLNSIQPPKLHLESLTSDFHLSNQINISRAHCINGVAGDPTTRDTVSLETNDNACDERPLIENLSTGISETPLGRSETLLSINDSSLDSSRLNLSANQSVLQLLDPLGADCLSFSDSELRPTSQMSLDLPLDLFPFHHT